MPRKIFGLSDQTKDTLTDNVKKFAAAWDCSTDYIGKILSQDRADPYPPFREFYVAHLRAGISTAEYDADLEFERERRLSKMPAKEIAACFAEKLHKQNRTIERYIEAGLDGQYDLAELDEIENMLIAESDGLRLLMQSVKTKREKLENEGPTKLRPVG